MFVMADGTLPGRERIALFFNIIKFGLKEMWLNLGKYLGHLVRVTRKFRHKEMTGYACLQTPVSWLTRHSKSVLHPSWHFCFSKDIMSYAQLV